MNGVLVVDKPPGPTSFAVVRKVRHLLQVKKVGHGGTLDPLASGVLPICVGEGTKLAPFLLDASKAYETTVRFGVETDTLDADGQVVATHPVSLDAAAVEAALASFRGEIDQVPPMYSALKREGRPLYQYARAGETVERAARRVHIHELTLLAFEPPDRARLRVRCSKGTYVRVLAADLGRTLAVGAHLQALRRTTSGPFSLGQAVTLETLGALVAAGEPLPWVSLAEALAHLPAASVDEPTALAVAQGKRLPWVYPDIPGPLRLLRTDGTLLAVIACASDHSVEFRRVFR